MQNNYSKQVFGKLPGSPANVSKNILLRSFQELLEKLFLDTQMDACFKKKKTVLLEKALRYDKSMDVIQKVRHSRKREEEVDKKGDEKYT